MRDIINGGKVGTILKRLARRLRETARRKKESKPTPEFVPELLSGRKSNTRRLDRHCFYRRQKRIKIEIYFREETK